MTKIIDTTKKLIYSIVMIRRIENRIFGRGLNNEFISWIQRLAAHFPIKGALSIGPDGSIKIIAEGEESELREFVSRLRRGTFLSEIEHFDIAWGEPTRSSQFSRIFRTILKNGNNTFNKFSVYDL